MFKWQVQIWAILIVATACSLELSTDPISVHASPYDADVVIYGGTPAGLSAATAVVRGHRTVIVIEPTSAIGGMITGGIAVTDTGTPQLVGGIAREFFEEVSAIEQRTPSPQPPGMVFHGDKIPWLQPAAWDLEPKVARQVFAGWVQQQKYRLILNERIVAVTKSRAKILAITLTHGSKVAGKVFIDASHEGDQKLQAFAMLMTIKDLGTFTSVRRSWASGLNIFKRGALAADLIRRSLGKTSSTRQAA